MFKRVSLFVLKFFRDLLAGTPIQRWKITAWAYGLIFHSAYGKGDIQVEYKGIKLILPAKDTAIVPSIAGGYFESLELDIFKELSSVSRNTIVDVGGNVGLYALLAVLNSSARVVSFEPVKENINYFKQNIAINNAERIRIEKKAVGEKQGKLKIYLAKHNVGTHSAVKAHSGGDKFIEVPLVTLDDYVHANRLKVDLLKVDVEGYDGMVYEGAERFIKKQKPTLFAEYAPVALKQNGYPPRRFLKNIFSEYDKAYIFDEKNHRLRLATKKELLAKDNAVVENLLLSSNKQHLKILDKFIN